MFSLGTILIIVTAIVIFGIYTSYEDAVERQRNVVKYKIDSRAKTNFIRTTKVGSLLGLSAQGRSFFPEYLSTRLEYAGNPAHCKDRYKKAFNQHLVSVNVCSRQYPTRTNFHVSYFVDDVNLMPVWDFNKVEEWVASSLYHVLRQDREEILKVGRNERLIASHLAQNLQNSILQKLNVDLKVDAPYNKHFSGPKLITGKRVEVDIAVHERLHDANNLLLIEMETNNAPKMDDIWKLEKMTHPVSHGGEYGYLYGLYLALGVGEKAGEILAQRWYTVGREFLRQV